MESVVAAFLSVPLQVLKAFLITALDIVHVNCIEKLIIRPYNTNNKNNIYYLYCASSIKINRIIIKLELKITIFIKNYVIVKPLYFRITNLN